MFSAEFWDRWWYYFKGLIGPAVIVTIRMLFFTMLFSLIFGFLLAVVLVMTNPNGGLRPRPKLYRVLNLIVNVIRSFPIIILIVAISPITRAIVGTTIGERAAVVPLTVAATQFLARIFETALLQVDKQLIEAARSFGASNLQIVFRVMLKEAVPSIVSGLTLTTISYIAASTLAGAVGAGGIGAVAMNYGYSSFNDMVLYTAVIILCIMVQVTQWVGNKIYKRVL